MTRRVRTLLARLTGGGRRAERGSAVVEFLGVALVLLLPVLYLVLTVGRLQAATFAVEGASREAARAFVTAQTADDGGRLAAAAVRLALDDQGFRPGTDVLTISCSATPCLEPGARWSRG
ncbi:TadE/TadG family type IV pilus assembly protein [Cellulosimicrobium cellulans]|uniref:TadE/TadG family type IV pilus assembly protein n=1 Tax=Cellulosimicrobium cellulans TaxID=1710 RepID=UPI00268C1152